MVKVFPNPFTKEAIIHYSVSGVGGKQTAVSVKICDRTGRLVKTLVNEEVAEGNYTIRWDGTDNKGNRLCEGIYFIRLNAGMIRQTKKIVLMK